MSNKIEDAIESLRKFKAGRLTLIESDLLSRYIKHVEDIESINYLSDVKRNISSVEFTDREWDILKELAK